MHELQLAEQVGGSWEGMVGPTGGLLGNSRGFLGPDWGYHDMQYAVQTSTHTSYLYAMIHTCICIVM